MNGGTAQRQTQERYYEEFMFHITEQVEEVTILRTSCYGVRINQTARCPELSLRWRFMRKIQVRLTAPIMPRKREGCQHCFSSIFRNRDKALIPRTGRNSEFSRFG